MVNNKKQRIRGGCGNEKNDTTYRHLSTTGLLSSPNGRDCSTNNTITHANSNDERGL